MRPFRHFATLTVLTLVLLGSQSQAAGEKKTEVSPKIDWAPYMKGLQKRVLNNWTDPGSSQPSRTVAQWKIHRDGSVSDIKIIEHGASAAEDKAAAAAIKAAAPFDPFPRGASEPCDVQFTFESWKSKPLGFTVAQALKQFGPAGKERLLAHFKCAGVTYPPKGTTWICLKQEKLLLLFAHGADSKWKQIASYPVVSASGVPGPKLKEGDLQVPEGFYKVYDLDARTHLCVWVNYPNATDRANAMLDRRTKLGGNIQVHAGVHSTGCVVLSNDDMAELFVLAHDTGCQSVDLIIAPCNLVASNADVDITKQPKWLPKLYGELRKAMVQFPIGK